jgi:hypothetical protein
MAMSESKQDPWQYAPWAVALVFGWLLWSKQPATPPGPQPEPVPSVSIEKDTASILKTMKVENAKIFAEAADRVEKGLLKTDKELFDFIRPATEAARKQANKPFDVSLDLSLPRNSDGTFAGKEVEAAALLRRISRSW